MSVSIDNRQYKVESHEKFAFFLSKMFYHNICVCKKKSTN